jgi:hypothetical protein
VRRRLPAAVSAVLCVVMLALGAMGASPARGQDVGQGPAPGVDELWERFPLDGVAPAERRAGDPGASAGSQGSEPSDDARIAYSEEAPAPAGSWRWWWRS